MPKKDALTAEEAAQIVSHLPCSETGLDPFVVVADGKIREAKRDKYLFRTRSAAIAALRGMVESMFRGSVDGLDGVRSRFFNPGRGDLDRAARITRVLIESGAVRICRLSEAGPQG